MTFRRTRCAHCRQKLTPERPSQIVHVECVEAWTEAQAARRERAEVKASRAAAKVERAETRRRKEAIKTLADLKGKGMQVNEISGAEQRRMFEAIFAETLHSKLATRCAARRAARRARLIAGAQRRPRHLHDGEARP